MKNYLICLAAVCFFLVIMIPQAFCLSLGGYYENDIVLLVKKDNATDWADLNRLRLRIDQEFAPNFYFHLEPRYYFLAKTEDLPIAGVTDVNRVMLDRAYFRYNSSALAVTVGKQRIAWGTGYIWNPTDVFNPFVLSFAVKEEEENNVESARIEVPIGEANGIDIFYANKKEWENAKQGIRGKINVGLFDLSLSYVSLGDENYQTGFDFAGEVFGVGVRGEVAQKHPKDLDSYTQAILGWDYTLENGIGLNMEYYYNEIGATDKADYDWIGYASGAISELGRDYLYIGVNKTLDELTEISGSFIFNLNDSGFIFYPVYTRSMSQNVDLSLESMLVFGKEGTEYNPSELVDPTGFGGSKLLLVRIIYSF